MNVYTFESLDSSERKTGKEIHDYCNIHGITSSLFPGCNLHDFRAEMLKITDSSNYDDVIILNIECHGLETKDGLKFIDGEIYWDELKVMLSTLNAKIGMRLIVLLSACHGAQFFSEVSMHDACPFYKFFGPDDEIYPDKIVETNKSIISAIANGEDLTITIQEKNKFLIHSDVKYIYFDAPELFKKAYSKYVEEDLLLESVKTRIANHQNAFERFSHISTQHGKPHQDVTFFKLMYGNGLFDADGMNVKFYEMLTRFLMITKEHYEPYDLVDFEFDEILKACGFEEKKALWVQFSKTL